jgi:hypothetical protein
MIPENFPDDRLMFDTIQWAGELQQCAQLCFRHNLWMCLCQEDRDNNGHWWVSILGSKKNLLAFMEDYNNAIIP